MRGYGHGYGWDMPCGCQCGHGPGGPGWAWPPTRDEFVEELEDYKANLESEIQALEKRIKALKTASE